MAMGKKKEQQDSKPNGFNKDKYSGKPKYIDKTTPTNFVQIDIAKLVEDGLSSDEIVLLTYLLNQDEAWKLNQKEIHKRLDKQFPRFKTFQLEVWAGLKKKGYIRSIGRGTGTKWYVTQFPDKPDWW